MTGDRIKHFVARLNKLSDADPESAHAEAEEVLIDALNECGLEDIASAFVDAVDRCGFWYA